MFDPRAIAQMHGKKWAGAEGIEREVVKGEEPHRQCGFTLPQPIQGVGTQLDMACGNEHEGVKYSEGVADPDVASGSAARSMRCNNSGPLNWWSQKGRGPAQ